MSKAKPRSEKHLSPGSAAVRAGHSSTGYGEHAEPLFATSSFCFNSAEQAAARFAGDEPGYVYSRYGNPTVRLFTERLAALEGSESCLATASGMAAIFATVMSLCSTGSRVVASRQLFGATIGQFENVVRKFGVEVVFVDGPDLDLWRKVVDKKADLVFVESPSNPQLEIYDLAALAEIAHSAGALFAVDNCVCTPFLQRPLEFGADLVIHSGTKYIDGQGRVLGGAVCASSELIEERLLPYLRCCGPSLSPFNAWVLAKGLETLRLRIFECSRVAEELAGWLAGCDGLSAVRYPHLSGSPGWELAKCQQQAGGGLISLVFAEGHPAAFRFLNALRLFSITSNFGDAKSIAVHPASTTHSRLEDDVRELIGIPPGLVRLSIGLEDGGDLRADIERGLAAANA